MYDDRSGKGSISTRDRPVDNRFDAQSDRSRRTQSIATVKVLASAELHRETPNISVSLNSLRLSLPVAVFGKRVDELDLARIFVGGDLRL